MIPIQAYIALAIAAAAFFGGWTVNGWRHDAAELAAQQEATRNARKAVMQVDRGAEAFEALKASQRVREVVVEKEVLREIQNPANAAECLSPDSMRILSGDLDASDARRGLAPALSSASAPG